MVIDKTIELSNVLDKLEPEEGLKWLSECVGKDLKFSTSLGIEDQVITHWIGSSHETQSQGLWPDVE